MTNGGHLALAHRWASGKSGGSVGVTPSHWTGQEMALLLELSCHYDDPHESPAGKSTQPGHNRTASTCQGQEEHQLPVCPPSTAANVVDLRMKTLLFSPFPFFIFPLSDIHIFECACEWLRTCVHFGELSSPALTWQKAGECKLRSRSICQSRMHKFYAAVQGQRRRDGRMESYTEGRRDGPAATPGHNPPSIHPSLPLSIHQCVYGQASGSLGRHRHIWALRLMQTRGRAVKRLTG